MRIWASPRKLSANRSTLFANRLWDWRAQKVTYVRIHGSRASEQTFKTPCLRRPNGRPSRLHRTRAATYRVTRTLVLLAFQLLCFVDPFSGKWSSSCNFDSLQCHGPERLPKGASDWFSAYPPLRLPRHIMPSNWLHGE